jgi:Chitin binding Peritrophin-A domain
MCFQSGMNLINVNVLCGGNYAYNPITNDCSLTLNHPICRGNQFTCNNVGDMGPWPLNPNIYYICMVASGPTRSFFPTIFRCPLGQTFQGGQCAEGNGIGGNVFDCQRAGLFPDPYDCHAYFHCDGLLRSQRIVCPVGTYFNQFTLGCIRGSC